MNKAEKYIQNNISNCSNIFEGYCPNGKQAYFPWIHPKQAKHAVEIAREETLQEVKEKLLNMLNTSIDNKHFFEQLDDYIDELEYKY